MQKRPDSRSLSNPLPRLHTAANTRWLKKSPGLILAALLAWGFAGNVQAQTASAVADSPAGSSAAGLLAKHAALASKLDNSVFGRPLVIESFENASTVNGNAYAVLDSPFEAVSTSFKSPVRWCEMMFLHLNTKYCKASSDTNPSVLKVYVGKKTAQELKDAFALEFNLQTVTATPGFLSVQVNADKGPLGTQDYRIALQAAPLPGGKTFMHLRYSYGYGMAGKLAMQAYLATLGSGKVGFTPDKSSEGADYIGGMRGAVERNTMRYYLAIESYMASLSKPASQQLDTRLEKWFDATEQYALQLREVERASYLSMKKSEYERQKQGL